MKKTTLNIYSAPSCDIVHLCGLALICGSGEIEFERDNEDILNW